MTMIFTALAVLGIVAIAFIIAAPSRGKTIYLGGPASSGGEGHVTLPGPVARLVGNASGWRVVHRVGGSNEKLDELLLHSGNPWGVTTLQLRALILLSTLAGAAAAGGAMFVLGSLFGALTGIAILAIVFGLVGSLCGAVMGFITPLQILSRKAQASVKSVVAELAETLDLLSMATASGLTIPQALNETYVFLPEGAMRSEIGVVRSDLIAGVPFSEAMHGLATRVPDENIRAFSRMLTDCVADGRDRTEFLRREAANLRNRRLSAIKKRAAKGEIIAMVLVAAITIFVAPIPLIVPMLPILTSAGG